ncbi:hypothetical protein ACVW0P_000202 [Mucilaginibacter sp. UYNi724]
MASVATKTYGDISSLHFKPIIPALFSITQGLENQIKHLSIKKYSSLEARLVLWLL